MTSLRDPIDVPISRPTPNCACGPWWRLPLLLAIVLIAILLYKWRGVRNEASVSVVTAPPTPAGTPIADTITLTIDFDDGHTPQTDKIAWTKGMTVRDLVNGVPRHSVSQQGSGTAAFLVSINDVKNEGSGGRNWIYSVNGERGDRSFAIYELQPGDHVLWNFAPPQ